MFDVHYYEIGFGKDVVMFSSEDMAECHHYIDERVAELRKVGYSLWSRSAVQDLLRNEDGTSILAYSIEERASDKVVEK